ncbi:MAG: hypothetical protein QOG44_1986 [Acidimicrobiaceae bacterium]|jgi:hypothetical protein|nr:hypothetical protein [Acidimicrobiaceae bacterium]
MDHDSPNPWQHINALYWSVSSITLRGIVDQVRTSVIELVAEIRAGIPDDTAVPSRALADQAVNIAVHGKKSRLTITTAQASAGGTTSIAPVEQPGSPFWTRTRRMGAFVAGTASVLALLFVIGQSLHWI